MRDGYISKEQFCKIAHIRKSAALRLLQEGLVPALDTGIPTRRYLIHWSDVEFYLKDREVDPEKYSQTHRGLTKCYPGAFDRAAAKVLQRYVEALWQDAPELLRTWEAAELLGYSPRSVRQWTRSGALKRLEAVRQVYIPKKDLVKFAGSETFHALPLKSQKHLHMLKEAFVCEKAE